MPAFLTLYTYVQTRIATREEKGAAAVGTAFWWR